MNKKFITGVVTVGILLGGATIAAASMNDKDESIVKSEIQSEVVKDKKSFLSVEEVKEIALAEQDGHVESVELENDDGYAYYEVEIENGDAEYEIYIHAQTGEVLKVETDDDDDNRKKNNSDSFITTEEAIQIAVEKVGGKVIEIELDEDDDRYEYEVELRTENGEAELVIDAVTGEIVEIETEKY